MSHRILGLAPLAVVVCGCSLIGLDNYVAPDCMNDNAFCAAANAAEGIALTDCTLYQCDRVSHGCVLRVRDDDSDGFVNASCAGAGGAPDCDDADPNAFPGAEISTSVLVTDVSLTGTARDFARWSAQGGSLGVTYPGTDDDSTGFQAVSLGDPPAAATSVGFLVDRMSVPFEAVALEEGCWNVASVPVPPPVEPPPLATCFAGHECCMMGNCCTTHAECQDTTFCENGYETCDPGSPAADPFTGCRVSTCTSDPIGPCPPCRGPDETCDEASRSCFTFRRNRTCRMGELAVAPAGTDQWLAAAVSVTGCGPGQLRVGWLSSGQEDLEMGQPGANFTAHGDERRTPAYWGIDVEPTGCTGASRGVGEPRGVSSPALVSLGPSVNTRDRRRAQGLVAYLAAPRCRGAGGCATDILRTGTPMNIGPTTCQTHAECQNSVTCDGFEICDPAHRDADPVTGCRPSQRTFCSGGESCDEASESCTVEAVGVELLGMVQEENNTPPIYWTTSWNNGAPDRLTTRTLGVEPPGLAPLDGNVRGYVLAYPAESGGIVARFITAPNDPSQVNQNTSPFATNVSTTSMARVTNALPDLGVEQMLPGGGGASSQLDGVVVAVVPAPMGDTTVLLAWVEDSAVWASTAQLDRTTGQLSGWSPRQLSTGSGAQPAVAYGSTICGPACEGFAVAWVDNGAVFLTRIALDGTDIDGAPVRLAGTAASHPQPITTNGFPRVVYHEASDQTLTATSAFCPAL